MTWHHTVNLVQSQISWAVLYFRDSIFSAFYRLFCKIANLWDIDLKFPRFLSAVNSDNPKNFVKLACLEVAFPKIRILVCNLQTRPDMSWCSFDFVPPYRYQHLAKIYSHTFCSFRNLSGDVSISQMPLSCQKRQMPSDIMTCSGEPNAVFYHT